MSNFFGTFYQNVRRLPPLALFSDYNKNTNNPKRSNNASEKNYFEKVLPYPELAYLMNGSTSSNNSYDKKKDPLGLIEKIIESVENFVLVVITI